MTDEDYELEDRFALRNERYDITIDFFQSLRGKYENIMKIFYTNKFNYLDKTDFLKDSSYQNWLKKKWKTWIAL